MARIEHEYIRSSFPDQTPHLALVATLVAPDTFEVGLGGVPYLDNIAFLKAEDIDDVALYRGGIVVGERYFGHVPVGVRLVADDDGNRVLVDRRTGLHDGHGGEQRDRHCD